MTGPENKKEDSNIVLRLSRTLCSGPGRLHCQLHHRLLPPLVANMSAQRWYCSHISFLGSMICCSVTMWLWCVSSWDTHTDTHICCLNSGPIYFLRSFCSPGLVTISLCVLKNLFYLWASLLWDVYYSYYCFLKRWALAKVFWWLYVRSQNFHFFLFTLAFNCFLTSSVMSCFGQRKYCYYRVCVWWWYYLSPLGSVSMVVASLNN